MGNPWELDPERKKQVLENTRKLLAGLSDEEANNDGETDDVDTLDEREIERKNDDEFVR